METEKTTIRLSDKDKSNVEKIMRTGIATNTSEAIRVALAVAPQFLNLWKSLMDAKVDNITEALVKLQAELRSDRDQSPQDFSNVNWTIEEVMKASPDTTIGEFLAQAAPRMDRTAIERLSQDLLEQYAAIPGDAFSKIAREELQRRGLMDDGLGHWVPNRPDLTVRVPGYQKARR